MPGILPDLRRRLREVLVRCSALDSDRALRTVFVDTRGAPWINRGLENTSNHSNVLPPSNSRLR